MKPAIDIIGTLFTEGEYAADGSVITEPVAMDGFHVNAADKVEGWEAFEVVPTNPRRIFAGHTTVFYKFVDEAEFKAKAIEVSLIQPDSVEFTAPGVV